MHKILLVNLQDETQALIWVPVIPAIGFTLEVEFNKFSVDDVVLPGYADLADVNPDGPVAVVTAWPQVERQQGPNARRTIEKPTQVSLGGFCRSLVN